MCLLNDIDIIANGSWCCHLCQRVAITINMMRVRCLLTFFSILLKTSKKYVGEEKLAQAAFPLATRPYIAHQKNISGGLALSLDCCINLSLFDESHFPCFKVGKVSTVEKIKKTSTRQDLTIQINHNPDFGFTSCATTLSQGQFRH